MALAIDEFYQKFPLRIGQFLHARLIFLHDALFDAFHVFRLCFLIRQRFQIFRRFHHDHISLLCNGKHQLDILYQTHVGTFLFLILKGDGRKDIDIVHFHILNAVPPLIDLADLHGRNESRTVHIDLLRFGFLCHHSNRHQQQSY